MNIQKDSSTREEDLLWLGIPDPDLEKRITFNPRFALIGTIGIILALVLNHS